ncbi:hypothetical protein SEA_RASOVI_2 [Microbacterium phage Rasovi]|nr:hypothetical protein SEA_RASOVI_2 [Microbacterium phage Rasovi]
MTSTEQELDEIRAKIDTLVYEAIRIRQGQADDDTGPGQPFMTGWILVYEFTNETLESEDRSADGVITPGPQSRATSRGLMGLGADHFTSA